MIKLETSDANALEIIIAFNDVLTAMEKECVDKIPLCTDAPGTTKEHCTSVFEWVCHAFLRRTISIAKEYSGAINRGEALSAAILGRALIETIAHFHHLLKNIEKDLKLKRFPRVYHLIASYALGGRHGFNKEDQKLMPLHINDSLRAIDETYKNVEKSHSWLSEFSHPNSIGTTLSFSKTDKANKLVLFHRGMPLEQALTILEAALWLPVFFEDWGRTKEVKIAIMSEWEPSENVCDLFEGKIK